MSDTDSGRPRRAAGEAHDGAQNGPDDVADAGPADTGPADTGTPDTGSSDAASADTGPTETGTDRTGTGRPSRAWAPAEDSGTGDAAPAAPEVSTPIPPPAPTLPEPAQPPATGRRFSAEDLPDDWHGPAPRRSAVSASSPPISPSEVSSPIARSRVAAALSGAADAGPDSEAGSTPAPDGRRRVLLWVAGVVAAALVVGLIVWAAVQRPGGTAAPAASDSATPATPSGPVSQASALAEDQLIAANDLAKLRKGVSWTLQDPSASTGVPRQPACIELSGTGGASPDAELNHLFAASKGGDTVLQVVQAWPDADSATTAYTSFLAQVGACKDGLLRNTDRVTGLADTATALTVVLPVGTESTIHTLLLARTGRFVSVVDAAASGETGRFNSGPMATASAASQGRQCGPAAGACPSGPKTVGTTPPVTETVGWLAWVDLPQVTPGAGTWTGTDPQAPKLVGSQCENVDLNKLSGASDAAHRTYLLTNDPKAPEGFGIDEAIYTFGKASGASSMAKQLAKNFDGCGDRTRTASVKDAAVSVPAADGKELKATSYLVTQRISESKTVTFRVGVAAVGNRLVYLLANPSGSFDFSDPDWQSIVGRAVQRATQLP